MGNYSFVGGGCGNNATGSYSGILGGCGNNTSGYVNSFIIGSDITANSACTTYMNNICVCNGGMFISNLPTTNPGVPGQLWNCSGQLMIS